MVMSFPKNKRILDHVLCILDIKVMVLKDQIALVVSIFQNQVNPFITKENIFKHARAEVINILTLI